MIPALLLGGGFGLGLCLLIAGLVPARPTLASALHRLDTAGRPTPQPAPQTSQLIASGSEHLPVRVRRWLGTDVARRFGLAGSQTDWGRFGQHSGDLAVTGTPAELHAGAKMLSALTGLAVPLVLTALLSQAGLGLPLLVPLWVSLTGAAVGWLLPDLRLRRAAADARRTFRGAVGAFLDLVAMRMASGSGLAEALHEAARIGAGPAFAHIRGALADARTDGITPTGALGRLGEQLQLPDLVELSTRLRLVDTSGAQAQASLRAQAASLRDRELSDAQGRANEQSQSMLVAQVVLGLGFVLFLGYPAVARVLAT